MQRPGCVCVAECLLRPSFYDPARWAKQGAWGFENAGVADDDDENDYDDDDDDYDGYDGHDDAAAARAADDDDDDVADDDNDGNGAEHHLMAGAFVWLDVGHGVQAYSVDAGARDEPH